LIVIEIKAVVNLIFFYSFIHSFIQIFQIHPFIINRELYYISFENFISLLLFILFWKLSDLHRQLSTAFPEEAMHALNVPPASYSRIPLQQGVGPSSVGHQYRFNPSLPNYTRGLMPLTGGHQVNYMAATSSAAAAAAHMLPSGTLYTSGQPQAINSQLLSYSGGVAHPYQMPTGSMQNSATAATQSGGQAVDVFSTAMELQQQDGGMGSFYSFLDGRL